MVMLLIIKVRIGYKFDFIMEGVVQMLKQSERESRNVNDFFYEMEGRQIQKMNTSTSHKLRLCSVYFVLPEAESPIGE